MRRRFRGVSIVNLEKEHLADTPGRKGFCLFLQFDGLGKVSGGFSMVVEYGNGCSWPLVFADIAFHLAAPSMFVRLDRVCRGVPCVSLLPIAEKMFNISH